MRGKSILAMILATELSFFAVCTYQLMSEEVKGRMSGNSLDRNPWYRGFKAMLISQFGKGEAESIWNKAGDEYKRMMQDIHDKKNRKELVLPSAALYKAIEAEHPNEAKYMLKAYGASYGIRMAEFVNHVTSAPGVSKLLWNNIDSVIDKASSEKNGYERRLVGDEQGRKGVDILVCPYFELAKKSGVPEACLTICAMDKEYMKGFNNIEYTRTKSLAEADEVCDYRLRYDASKK